MHQTELLPRLFRHLGQHGAAADPHPVRDRREFKTEFSLALGIPKFLGQLTVGVRSNHHGRDTGPEHVLGESLERGFILRVNRLDIAARVGLHAPTGIKKEVNEGLGFRRFQGIRIANNHRPVPAFTQGSRSNGLEILPARWNQRPEALAAFQSSQASQR